MLYVYPASVRRAIACLLRCNLDISRLSSAHARVLLEYGMHGDLPVALYEHAVALDPHSVVFFPPAAVRVRDLQRALCEAPELGPPLLRAVHFHKRALLRDGDGAVLRKLLETNAVTDDDVSYLIRERCVSPASIVKLNPRLATRSMRFSPQELEDIFRSVRSERWEELYERLDLVLRDILWLAARAAVPPLHAALQRLEDTRACLALVMRFPHARVLDFVSPLVKYERGFVRALDNFVAAQLPALWPDINRFLFRAVPKSQLLRRYGIKFHAMFSFACEPFPDVDASALSAQDAAFVEAHIHTYDQLARAFSLRFRQHVQRTQNRVLTMLVGDTRRPPARPRRSSSVEDLLQHLDHVYESRTPRLARRDLEGMLSAHRYDVSLCKRVLMADASTRVKKKVLRIMRGWKACGTLAHLSYTKVTQSTILLDIFTHLVVRIFHSQRELLAALDKNSDALFRRLPLCQCARCAELRTLRAHDAPALRSRIFAGAPVDALASARPRADAAPRASSSLASLETRERAGADTPAPGPAAAADLDADAEEGLRTGADERQRAAQSSGARPRVAFDGRARNAPSDGRERHAPSGRARRDPDARAARIPLRALASEATDECLLAAVHDLAVLAAHGVVDTRFVPASSWGPLAGMLRGLGTIDVRSVRDALTHSALNAANLGAGGVRSAHFMVHVRHVNAYRFTDYDTVLRFGEAYVRVVLFFNFLLEYLFVVSLYRLVVMRAHWRFREFVSKMINCFLEGFGVCFCAMRVNDCVDNELADYMQDNGAPFHTYHLYAKVILVILEHLNGTR
ncbi:MC042 [Molluscum contagiosum virus subtype 2]|nr:MC042 [Molluscum contagiosum virus subtype 2]AYO87678.1 MC042 [Molluscum contagiosum virus subtype 2]AYO88018.1 MC042 [Molluscum contagiosum virus subtype 2]AYO88188.1 MC042 [Molluscum contagiosum virus subtype 2]AYO89066.1 MC042 [Molluscum contagiosum virus subtype 2]